MALKQTIILNCIKSTINRITRSLKTLTAKIILLIGAIFSLYHIAIQLQTIYSETFPALHAFASPADFKSVPYSVENRSKIFSIKLQQQSCLILKEDSPNKNIKIQNNLVNKDFSSQNVALTPLSSPININCTLASAGIAGFELTGLVARVTVSYKIGRFDYYFFEQQHSATFTWRNGKWFEGDIL